MTIGYRGATSRGTSRPIPWSGRLVRDGAAVATHGDARPSRYPPEDRLLRGRPVAVGAHGVWGDSRGTLAAAEVGLHQARPAVAGRQRVDVTGGTESGAWR